MTAHASITQTLPWLEYNVILGGDKILIHGYSVPSPASSSWGSLTPHRQRLLIYHGEHKHFYFKTWQVETLWNSTFYTEIEHLFP